MQRRSARCKRPEELNIGHDKNSKHSKMAKNVNDRNRRRVTTSEEIPKKAVYQNSKYDRIQGKCLRGYFAGEC